MLPHYIIKGESRPNTIYIINVGYHESMAKSSVHFILKGQSDYKDLAPVFKDIMQNVLENADQVPEEEEFTMILHLNLEDLEQNRKPEGVNVMYSRGCDWTEDVETKFSELGDERAWEYELLQPLQKTVWSWLKTSKIELPCFCCC